MAREARDTVVSLRISAEEQAQLREVAEARGSSVSDLIRSAALRELHPRVVESAPTTTTPAASRTPRINEGIFWCMQPDSNVVVEDGTITLRA